MKLLIAVTCARAYLCTVWRCLSNHTLSPSPDTPRTSPSSTVVVKWPCTGDVKGWVKTGYVCFLLS